MANPLFSGSNDFTIKSWDLNAGVCLATFDTHTFPISGLAFHPDGKFFISSSHDSTIKVWDTKENLCQANFKGQTSRDSSFYSDDRKDISGSLRNNFIRVFDRNTYREAILQGHSFPVNSINLHPDDKTIISRSEDNMIKLWDFYTGECLLTLTGMLGFYLAGCSFKNLHPDSQLSEKGKNFMRQHGAIFDENDEKCWNEAIHRAFPEE